MCWFYLFFRFLFSRYFKCKPDFLILDDISEDGEQEFVDSIQKEESTSTRESSPLKETLKETLLNRFSSKFSTNSSTANQANSGTSVSINDGDLVPILSTEKSSPDLNLQESENQKGAAGGTWLHTVKGRIAKTVEEKYTEYKNEKEMRKLHQQPNAHRFGFCVSNFLSILSDFLSLEKLTH